MAPPVQAVKKATTLWLQAAFRAQTSPALSISLWLPSVLLLSIGKVFLLPLPLFLLPLLPLLLLLLLLLLRRRL